MFARRLERSSVFETKVAVKDEFGNGQGFAGE